MVLIPGGIFQMGIDAADIPRFQKIFAIENAKLFQDELPRHTVTVADFYLDKHLVTNAQFQNFLQAKPYWRPKQFSPDFDNSNFVQHWPDPDQPNAKPDHPAVNVNWYVAAAFCAWAGARLPTEAEWEFAARGGKDNVLFPWGDGPPDQSRANFADNVGTTTPVEAYSPNAFGLYDMAGNVWQFLADDWTKYPDHAVTGMLQHVSQEELEKYAIHPNAARKVIRGGSYSGAPINLWVEYRDSHPANGSRNFVGFRCARSTSAKTPSQ
jgi:formylglycine-generating enzyme required for sulfatase activity